MVPDRGGHLVADLVDHQLHRLRPRDYTESWSQSAREFAPEWLKHAKGRRLGGIMVFTPPDESPACALIHPPKPNHFPQIIIQDKDADGTLDSLLIGDKRYQSFLLEDEDADGFFDSSQYSTGVGTNSVLVLVGPSPSRLTACGTTSFTRTKSSMSSLTVASLM